MFGLEVYLFSDLCAWYLNIHDLLQVAMHQTECGAHTLQVVAALHSVLAEFIGTSEALAFPATPVQVPLLPQVYLYLLLQVVHHGLGPSVDVLLHLFDLEADLLKLFIDDLHLSYQ